MSVNIPTTSKPRIVIIGGGFGGLELAKRLRKSAAQVLLIDKHNYHTFQPLLYQVATAALEPDSIAYPFREIFRRGSKVLFRMAEVNQINPADNYIVTSIGNISYDYLVLAMGTKTNFFKMKDIEEHALRMKTIPQAMELRNLILESFEKALLTENLTERESLMSFVVAGGGPTGIETVGALGELKRSILPRDYPELDLHKMQIHIVDAEERLLFNMSQNASQSAQKYLEKFDVNIWLKNRVTAYDGQTVALSNGKKLNSRNLIWAAGVSGAVIAGLDAKSILPNNRIIVDENNRVKDSKNIFAIGDIAAMLSEKYPHGHPQLAPVAVGQAKILSKNLRSILLNKPLKPYEYKDIGVMATVGRNNAVVDLKIAKFDGVFGWFFWLFVHLMTLVGFRNKLVALINWAWSYFSYNRGLRLIIKPFIKNTGND